MKSSLGKDAVKLTASQVITLSIAMLTAMLLSHFRTLEEYGTYSQLLMISNIVTALFMLGLPNSINFFLASTTDTIERQKFISNYFSLSTLLGIIAGLLLILSISLIVGYFKNPLLKNFMFMLAVYPWTRIIMSSIDAILIIYQKTTVIMFFRIFNSLFLLSIVLVAEVFNLSFMMYMVFFVIGQALFTISVYFTIGSTTGELKFNLDKKLITKILKFSIPIGLATMVGTIGIELDKLVIARIYNTEQLAIYTNAAKEMPVTVIASSLTAVLLPKLVHLLKNKNIEEAVYIWGDTTTLSYLFICFFAATLYVYAPDIITLLYSDKYLSGVDVFRVYSITLLLRCTYFGIILNALGKTKFILYSSIASLILNLLLNYPFYKIFGFIGPAVATFVSIILIQLIQLKITAKSIQIPFKRIFPWRTLAIITVVNLVLGIVFSSLKDVVMIKHLTGEIVESIIMGLLWGLVYFILFLNVIKQKWNSLNN